MYGLLQKFKKKEDGAVLVEALVAVPFLVILAAGLVEFSNVFWQRGQVEAGLRDYARYLARCPSSRPESECIAVAQNLAFFGNVVASGPPRTPGWTPQTATITPQRISVGTYEVWQISTDAPIQAGPVYTLLNLPPIVIAQQHNQRIFGL